ncbi:transcription factor, partial [Halorubrum sp. SD626R]
EQMYSVYDQFLTHLSEIGVDHNTPELVVNNVVAVGDLGQDVNLNALSIGLGLENVEYEPEQFPALIYRPAETNCVLLVFTSGKVVITAGKSIGEDTDAFKRLQNSVEDIFS